MTDTSKPAFIVRDKRGKDDPVESIVDAVAKQSSLHTPTRTKAAATVRQRIAYDVVATCPKCSHINGSNAPEVIQHIHQGGGIDINCTNPACREPLTIKQETTVIANVAPGQHARYMRRQAKRGGR